MSAPVVELVCITLFAAIVNGGLGYGFSSITVPLALLFLSNRVLNPALVLIEVLLNMHQHPEHPGDFGGPSQDLISRLTGEPAVAAGSDNGLLQPLRQ